MRTQWGVRISIVYMLMLHTYRLALLTLWISISRHLFFRCYLISTIFGWVFFYFHMLSHIHHVSYEFPRTVRAYQWLIARISLSGWNGFFPHFSVLCYFYWILNNGCDSDTCSCFVLLDQASFCFFFYRLVG